MAIILKQCDWIYTLRHETCKKHDQTNMNVDRLASPYDINTIYTRHLLTYTEDNFDDT